MAEPDAGTRGDVRVAVDADPRVNFALQQNAVPFVKRVVVENAGAADLADVVVELSTRPEVAARTEIRIDRIAAGTSHVLAPVVFPLLPDVLARQSEREAGSLHVRVLSRGTEVASAVLDFEVLAYDEWNGTASLPEILAAFVLPNHPEVDRILGAAAALLGGRTRSAALDGYQSRDPERALAIAEAVYDAVCALGLTYANPPASFETTGQKVRTPDRVAETRFATCLDLSLLVAACLEQAGLHPLVVLVQGHAFAGVWLVDESFPETATTEPYRILKRVELDAIRVFETTGVTARPPMPFSDALREGRSRLADVDRFLFSVDVASARRGRIRPIPLRAAPGTVAVVAEIREVADGVPAAPLRPVGGDAAGAAADGPATPRGRLDRWKRKLLDLSLRNRLLNWRETKQSAPFLLPDLAAIEDTLASGAALEVCAHPRLLGADDPRTVAAPDAGAAAAREAVLRAFVASELRARRLATRLSDDELAVRLLEIYRNARTSLEEGGANTLYVAFGFLAWYETPSSAEPRLAPILLVPATLERTTAMDRFRVRLLDDDARLNVTLLQKLRAEHGVEVRGVDPLPEDESGIDVAAVLRAFREAVLHLPRWHVRDDAALGLFSFTKYLMWLDLEARHDVLARNAVVRHLIERAGEPFDPGGAFPDEATLDDTRDPATTWCPLDADSSQLAAVHAAADGRTFVLQGPPGTGKSQTITNVIAQCLATGRRVLFVSEKMAALDVVHRRLERTGLGPFCLPLHSNKAQKREVLDRLAAVLELGAQAAPAEWEAQARELRSVRASLNGYCRSLHLPRAFGLTAFQSFSALIGLRDAHEVALDLGDGAAADLPARAREAVLALVAEGNETGGVAGHPLLPVRLSRWQPSVDHDARRLGRACAESANALIAAADALATTIGIAPRAWSGADVELLAEACELLTAVPRAPTRGLLVAEDFAAAYARIAAEIAAGRDRDARRQALLARYRPPFLDAPVDAWAATLRDAGRSWAIVRWWKGRPVRRAMDALRADASALDDSARLRDLDEVAAVRVTTERLAAPASDGSHAFGAAWRSGESEWHALDAAIAWAARVQAFVTRAAAADVHAAGSAPGAARVRLRDAWVALAAEGRDLFLQGGRLTGAPGAFAATRDTHGAARRALVGALAVDEASAFGPPDAAGAVARAHDVSVRIAENAGRLRPWCGYQRARAAACDAALAPLVAVIESGALTLERLPAAFERSLHAWALRRALAEDPALADFSSTRHGVAIERFREIDRRSIDAASGALRAKLAAGLPRVDPNVAAKGEMGVLRREIQKKRRHLPLRRLFEEIPHTLARIKPCMLMSPLSVAQYLSPDFSPFDVVVFDEASQIPVWDAIGAIARGERLVVVGDSRQLPPTSFFEKEESEEETDEDDVEDLESILDECVAAGLPERTLDWHYRSRHESLIAFSNRHYYRGRLHTFPSAEASVARMGVSLRPVPDGVYDKGHTRANRREAEELVAELVRRLLDPAESMRSVGVVTFSMAQQVLVEDLLDAARRLHPEIEPHFANDRAEPVFVKNLENVQGDERDVILFSVCYGPDEHRRVYMNFGPLNRTGGERRLNVAITRAREQVVVFSTLRADQIDLARTRALGVEHLKAFLEYAERGSAALGDGGPAAAAPTGAGSGSPFEADVERTLVARGWNVHRQVGCSGYRIDLAVTDPERPGRHVLGIECDGASYHSGRTARDRDRLRGSVLRSLGWTLHRVWSTDWWYDPAREIARIEDAIARARAEAPATSAAAASPEGPATPATSATPAARATPASPVAAGPDAAPVSSTPDAPKPDRFGASTATASSGDAAVAERAPTYAAPQRPAGLVYPAPVAGAPRGAPESLADARSDDALARAVRDVVEAEAPVTLDLTIRRVAALWGVGRVTARVSTRIGSVVHRAGVRVSRDDDEIVLWRATDDPAAFRGFRLPRDVDAPERTADQVPLVEIVGAVAWALEAHVSATADEVARDVAGAFGIRRVGANVRARIDAGIAAAVRRGVCTVANGIVTLAR